MGRLVNDIALSSTRPAHGPHREPVVLCVASGPSLTRDDVRALAALPQIAVNDGYRYTPGARAVFCADPRWWHRNSDAVTSQCPMAAQFTLEHGADPPVVRLPRTAQSGLERVSPGIRSGGHSGYAAIGVAYHWLAEQKLQQGATIALLGYDMQASTDEHGREVHHFFGEHPDGSHPRYPQWIGLYCDLKRELALEGVRLVNASRSTALRIPRVSVESLL